MKRKSILSTALFFLLAAAPLFAAEPLLGEWQMIYLKAGGHKLAPESVAIRIVQAGQALQFAYLRDKERVLQMAFTVRPDGPEAPIKDLTGNTMGSAKLAKVSATEYTLTLKANGRKAEPGKMTLSENGAVVTIETDTEWPGIGPAHVIQVFAKLPSDAR